MTGVSVVVPVFNEEENIKNLHAEILEVCKNNGYDFEIIFVDDGSGDGTEQVCKTLTPLKYIRLRRNFGQTAAMDAGIKHASKEYIVTLDGDGQNDPHDIPQMIKYLENNNLDVVSGWRKNRKDSFMKRFVSRGANFLRYILIHDGIHDSGCSLKVYKRECFENVRLYGEMHRFIPALLEIKGFRIGEIVVNHRPRTAGKTKYNWKRTIKGFIDMISVWFWHKYSVRPMHILGSFGLLFLGLGFCTGIWSVVLFLQGRKMSDNIFPPMFTVLFVIIGLMMFIFGLMSDMLAKTYYGVGIDVPYSIKEITDTQTTEPDA